MSTEEILTLLCLPQAPSGMEEAAGAVFSHLIAPYVDTVEHTSSGNVIARKKGKGKRLLIEAHSDEVGLMVTEVNGGFLKFLPVGGIDFKILPACAVTVYGRKPIPGIIGLKPPHLQKKEDDRTLSADTLLIDTGLDDASALVRPGDTVAFSSPYLPLLNGRAASRCMDDRACLAALILAAEQIKQTDYDICFAATSGEEVGLRGAKCLAKSFMPDISVSLDVTFGENFGSQDSSFPLGAPTLCISPSLSMPLTRALEAAANDAGVSISYEAASGSSGTNAWAIAAGSFDAHTALISVPIRYMHTLTEVLSLSDIEAAAKIVAQFVNGGERYAF